MPPQKILDTRLFDPARARSHPLWFKELHRFAEHMPETLEYARQNRERVSLWGPYECRTSFYRRFLVQKHFLETSGIGYQCVDNWGEAAHAGDGTNCIHAITHGSVHAKTAIRFHADRRGENTRGVARHCGQGNCQWPAGGLGLRSYAR